MNRMMVKKAIIIAMIVIAGTFSAAFLKNESKDFKLVKNLDIYYSLFRELNAFYVDDIDPDRLVKTSIDEMLKTLDPYTVYYSEQDIDDFQFMTTGKYGGIGSLIRVKGDYAVLTQIYKGFPADLAELKAGDILKSINGESLKGLSITKISEKLKGDPNTEVTLTIERQGADIEKKLTRKRVAIPPVPYYGMIGEDIGYIRFTNFTQNCTRDVKHALVTLKNDHGANKIILDMRSNPGGLLTEAVEIVNLFVGSGQEVVSTKGKVNQYDATHTTTRQAVDEDIPLVVMINSNSASASEIVAGAIQDLDRGIVVGQRSYGKGLVQISRPLSYNTTLKVTTAKYYIPSGRCIQALDFSHRNEDGSVGYIPDSLISEFKTKNGRIVKDGGGLIPDYSVESMQLSQIATELYLRSFIFDFATEYFWDHETIDIPQKFSLTDQDCIDFANYLKTREFSYNNSTERALNALTTTAKKEKYYEINRDLFDQLKDKLEHSLDNDLKLFRDEISKLLEDEIIGRYYYEDGVIKHTINDDKQIAKAIEVVSDKIIYSLTLKGESGTLSSGPLSSTDYNDNNSLEFLHGTDIPC